MGVETWAEKGYFKDDSKRYHIIRRPSIFPLRRQNDIYLEVGQKQLYKCNKDLRPHSYVPEFSQTGQLPEEKPMTIGGASAELGIAFGRAASILFPSIVVGMITKELVKGRNV